MSVNRNLVNVAIILVLAGIVTVSRQASWGLGFIGQVVSLAFLAAIAWIASRMYREHRVAIYSLGGNRRAVLYVAVGVATLTFSASDRLLRTGPGSVAFLLILGACAVAVYRVFRSTRTY
jgi:hypothetical protein